MRRSWGTEMAHSSTCFRCIAIGRSAFRVSGDKRTIRIWRFFRGWAGIRYDADRLRIAPRTALRQRSGRRKENAIIPTVAAGAACLIGVHTLVDFSLQIQAVALTFMAMLGAGVAQSESSRVALED